MAKSPPKNVAPYGWPTETILPDENDGEFESFMDALMIELAPRTQYARSVATDIVYAIWDIQRHRRLLGSAVRGEFKRQAAEVLTRGLPRVKLATPEILNTANEFPRDLLAKVPEALEVLGLHGMTVSELTAASYEARASTVAYHETRIADLERRRAKLMSEYERLQSAARPRDIEDAVEVD